MDIDVKVVARSAASAVAGAMADGTLKVKVAAIPEKGQANAELCAVLSRHFKVPLSAVTVIAGATSTRKRVRIEGLS